MTSLSTGGPFPSDETVSRRQEAELSTLSADLYPPPGAASSPSIYRWSPTAGSRRRRLSPITSYQDVGVALSPAFYEYGPWRAGRPRWDSGR